MSGVVSLSHWCENHGPSIVFCTQAFHLSTNPTLRATPPSDLSIRSGSNSTASSISEHHRVSPLHAQSPPLPALSESSPPISKPSSSSSSVSYLKQATSPSSSSSSSSVSQGNVCSGCRPDMPFMEDKEGDKENAQRKGTAAEYKALITYDDSDPNIYYYGSRIPRDAHMYGPVKNACIRSLHSEFCLGRDGPILFGDDKNGYVLSYMFRIKDLQARGESRFYSLMMLMTDRVYLVDCWGFLVSKFRAMATSLQNRANAIYDSDRFIREKSQSQPTSRRLSTGGSFVSTSPEQFLRRRGTSPLRSLADLLGVKDLFVQMHAQFGWILRATGRRKREIVWTGRPMGAYMATKRDVNININIKKKDEAVERTAAAAAAAI